MAKSLTTLFYSALNVPMRMLLRSPFHAITSHNLCCLIYTGRRSGKRYETPLSYVRTGDRIWLLSSVDTRWWTNFLPQAGAPLAVEVLAAGKTLRGRAQTIQHDRERLRREVEAYLTALPRDAAVYAIGLDAERRPKTADLERALPRLVMVEVTLEA